MDEKARHPILMTFGTVAILGPGLIGGSLALALAERGLTDRLVIYARNDTSFPAISAKLPQAELTTDVSQAVRGADVVVLCVPIEAMVGLVREFRDALKPGALVTDVGSVKGSVDRDLAPLLEGRALWIGSHPMAGSEKSGFAAARADLFDRALVILTPPDRRNKTEALEKAYNFWKGIMRDGRVVWIEPEYHDLVVAEISHLPHFLASLLLYRLTETGRELVPELKKMPYSSTQALEFAGPGFRDTTRTASGSPELWTEILWDNRSALSEHVGALMSLLANVKGILNEHDSEKGKREIFKILKSSQSKRAELLDLNNKRTLQP
ncbi:MAG: prephenate dehydrogenase/arogenate dehydrogenase family protein [Methylacidiphilales bacterium]|nr:prephenate dehydrogenase/arogenate dehydrogenase family protein [Candidatus Methylacidiphilales bacterium]